VGPRRKIRGSRRLAHPGTLGSSLGSDVFVPCKSNPQ
jgi:hypothetical protein